MNGTEHQVGSRPDASQSKRTYDKLLVQIQAAQCKAGMLSVGGLGSSLCVGGWSQPYLAQDSHQPSCCICSTNGQLPAQAFICWAGSGAERLVCILAPASNSCSGTKMFYSTFVTPRIALSVFKFKQQKMF